LSRVVAVVRAEAVAVAVALMRSSRYGFANVAGDIFGKAESGPRLAVPNTVSGKLRMVNMDLVGQS
jgi:hypothetical protein